MVNMMIIEIAHGTRVQDRDGFTGTVTDFAEGDDTVEVTWDVSGCTSDVKVDTILPETPGLKEQQEEIHARIFGSN